MGKFTVSQSIVVDAPIEQVFESLTNPQMQSEWMSGESERRNYSPPLEVGKRWEGVNKFMGREMVSRVEVLELNRPHLYRFHIEGPMSGDFQHRCETVDKGVQVTISFEGEASSFFANLAIPLITRQAKQRMQGDLEAFKQFIES